MRYTRAVIGQNFQTARLTILETDICETTEGVKAYAGHVHLPPNPDVGRRSYPVNTFFWFFSAREDAENAPLSLWFAGGPGVPSIPTALGSNGPCRVNIDSQTTSLNPWSWSNKVNMLYIDQPVQVGFSYDILTNGTINELKNPFLVAPLEDEIPETNMTTLTGTFSSQDFAQAPNTTEMAAVAVWEAMQIFMESFEPYTPVDNKLSIWGESYAGHWVPGFASYFQTQNMLIDSGDLTDAEKLNLDTIGLVNACVDLETQLPHYPQMAYNNLYGIKAISEEEHETSLAAWPQCKNLTRTCRSMTEEMDPHGWGQRHGRERRLLLRLRLVFQSHPIPLPAIRPVPVRHPGRAAQCVPSQACRRIPEPGGRPTSSWSAGQLYWAVLSCRRGLQCLWRFRQRQGSCSPRRIPGCRGQGCPLYGDADYQVSNLADKTGTSSLRGSRVVDLRR